MGKVPQALSGSLPTGILVPSRRGSRRSCRGARQLGFQRTKYAHSALVDQLVPNHRANMPWMDHLTAREKAALGRADDRRKAARTHLTDLLAAFKVRASARVTDPMTEREMKSLKRARERRQAAREAYNALRSKLKSRAEARARRQSNTARSLTRSLKWVSFEDRQPTQAERESDRLIGFFHIRDWRGEVVSDWLGKIFFHETQEVWMTEVYSNSLSLVRPGCFETETVRPTHWALVPRFPS